jgi:predicted acylesterase/phospholipase RssA
MAAGYCPSPGPPCYTVMGSIAWERKYFDNPIVSDIPINYIRVLDKNGNIILTFKLSSSSIPDAHYYYYIPDPEELSKFPNEGMVTYVFDDGTTDSPYQFSIKIC